MFRYLLNVLWVVLGQPHRVVKPYRPSLLIECDGFCCAVYDNHLIARIRRKAAKEVSSKLPPSEDLVDWSQDKNYTNYALNA